MISYLQTDNISRYIGERVLFENISLNINEGEKVALIAKNGTGKTSLLDIISGIQSPDTGTTTVKRDLKIGYLTQEPVLIESNTVLEEALSGNEQLREVVLLYETALTKNNNDSLPDLILKMDELNAWEYEAKAKTILTVLKLDVFEQKVGTLSGGQKKRLSLAKVLLSNPELLILDEPTNHLDLDMIEWLEDFLGKTSSAILMVTHDRYFLDRVCNVIYEMDDSLLFRYNGNYEYYLSKREERILNQQSNIEKAQNLMRKELDWIRRMPKARGTKAKYRVDAFEDLKEKASKRITNEKIDINVQTERMGKKILEIHNISKSFGDINVIKNFSYTFNRFEKIGIVGINGSGKSTLLNLITNRLQPDNGNIDVGQTIKFGYYQQMGIEFDNETKVIDVVRKIAEVVTLGDGSALSVTQFLTHFLFPPSTHYNYVYKLSGGEKRRLYLVTVLMQNPNFLILDEPTNDLDIMTLNVLEDYLAGFKGCVVIVSHDRYFMDKLVDHIFVFKENGLIKDFPGNYTQYRIKEDSEKQSETTNSESKRKVNPDEIKTNKPKKLSYKEKIEFEQIEDEIEKLENEKEELENLLNSGTLNNEELVEKSNYHSTLNEQIEEKTLRWMELSEKQ